MKQKLKNFWPYLISAILLVVLFSRIDFKDTWEAVKTANMTYLLAAMLIQFVSSILILWRWIILMKALGLKFKRFNSARWFFIGQFLNLILPSSVGGDVFKGLGLSKETGHRPKVFASIVLDRMIGFVAIVMIAAVSFFFGRKIVNNQVIALSIICMVGGLMTIAIVLFSHRIFSQVTKIFGAWPKVKDGLMKLHYDLVLMKGKLKEVVWAMLLSILAQIIFASEFYFIAKAMHQKIGLVYFIIFSPLVCVVSSLPSIGGLGVREVGWVSLLSILSVPQGIAMGLSLISFALLFIVGIFGGLFYVATLSAGRVQHHQADAQFKPGHA